MTQSPSSTRYLVRCHLTGTNLYTFVDATNNKEPDTERSKEGQRAVRCSLFAVSLFLTLDHVTKLPFEYKPIGVAQFRYDSEHHRR